ncbi:MAG TPA: outer membrane beta-barrel protein [Flavisolibacter sp.]|nr:outer membrane beta-barrel protein [Flavisolibacter sp.]
MKKIFICALALAGFTAFNKAEAQKGFSLSVKATPQFSFLQNSDDNNNSSIEKKATFNTNFGIGAGYDFNKNIGVALDVLYSLQGQRYTTNDVEVNQKVNYIKVPVYFTYNTDPSKPVSFIAKVGPQVSFLTGSKLADKDGNDIVSDTKDAYKSATFGGAAGAGVQFKLSSNLFLNTNVRFDYDFTNAEDDSYISYPQGRAKTYNMTTGLEVGLKYVLR